MAAVARSDRGAGSAPVTVPVTAIGVVGAAVGTRGVAMDWTVATVFGEPPPST